MTKKPDLTSHKAVLHAPAGTHLVTTGLRYKSNGNGCGDWKARYQVHKVETPITIGKFPDMTLAQAKELHEANRVKAKQGINPKVQLVQRVIENVTAGLTVQQVVTEAYEAFKPTWKCNGARNGFWPKMEKYVFPAIGSELVSAMDGVMLYELCAPMWQDKHPTADKILIHLSKVLKYAAARKIQVDRMAVKDARELLGRSRYQETPAAALDFKEVPGYYATLGEEMTDLALRFLILTGLRANEAAGLLWEEMDSDDLIIIGADRMKNGEMHGIPVVPQVREILEKAASLYSIGVERTGPVFKNPDAWVTGHVSANNWSQTMRRQDQDFRTHGFRTTFNMWGTTHDRQETEIILEECLAHKVRRKMSLKYLRGELSILRRPVMQRWADFVTGVAA